MSGATTAVIANDGDLGWDDWRSAAELSPALAVGAPAGPEPMLSVIIPTFNEVENIGELLRRLAECLQGLRWEAVIVDDDSADGTANAVLALGEGDARIRCLRRIGRRGLSSACLEGMAAAQGDFYAIMDADLQHDERLLPAMFRALSAGSVDLVVGSRYLEGGCVDSWSRPRRAMSRLATTMARVVLNVDLSDPMSGFFMIRPEVVHRCASRLSGTGFKLLLDLVATAAPAPRVVELPYRFAARQHGRSKLDLRVMWAFVVLLAERFSGTGLGRFSKFCLIGTSGVVVHFTVLLVAGVLVTESFPAAQTMAVIASMISNFALNNRLTFADARLNGARFFSGLSRFALLCSVGAVVNVLIAQAARGSGIGRVAAATAGIVAGAACNYLTTSALVWRSSAARRP